MNVDGKGGWIMALREGKGEEEGEEKSEVISVRQKNGPREQVLFFAFNRDGNFQDVFQLLLF